MKRESEPVTAPEGIRVSKRLAELGLCSRREADAWIGRGLVLVNGKPAVLGQRVRPDDRVELAHAARQEQSQLVSIVLNKPIGYVSGQAEDGYLPARVLVRRETRWRYDTSPTRFSPAQLRGLVPAGRLDIDSTGLLILTQDGRVARSVIGQDRTVDKEYLVRVADRSGAPARLSAQGLALLRHGLELDGEPLRPAQVEWINGDELRFVLHEGKKRQVRRMCEAVGLKVLRLKRVRIGGVRLGHLPYGQWRYLAPGELQA